MNIEQQDKRAEIVSAWNSKCCFCDFLNVFSTLNSN